LEAYNDGLDPIKSFMGWERELPTLIRKLRNEHVHYAQIIRQLLEPITTEAELDELLGAPGGAMWKSKDMSQRLQDKLQESFHAYKSTIADIEAIMINIARKLDVERAAEVNRHDLEALLVANPQKNNKFEFGKRVRFGMSKKNIKARLDELHECNKELERFTNRSEKLETYRKTTKPLLANRLKRIQGLAQNLHATILASWSCSCKSYHKTNLQLEQRGNLFSSGMAKLLPSHKTCFVVSFSSAGDAVVHPWTWQEAQIDIEEEEPEPDKKTTAHSTTPKKPKVAKTVSFGGDKPPPPYSTIDPSDIKLPSFQEVQDLCASIQQLHKTSSYIGLSLDSKNILRGIYPIKPASDKQYVAPSEVITLEDLLRHPPTINGRPAKLSKKERYSLAVTLASSALQLASTPWLHDQWSGKDIVFYKTSSGTRLVDIEHPYISSKLLGLSKDNVQSTSNSCMFHNKNTVLLALAIALLELYFGESAEQHRQSQVASSNNPYNPNPWEQCAMAFQWAQAEQENMSAAFSSAVTHCLKSFNDPSASLQDVEFLQAAIESIVLPLQEELSQFLGKTGR
ncbi:hypothetical protein B0J11DRAFT_437222, partial [Dendryphion nanum]